MKYVILFLFALIVPTVYAQNSSHLGEISWDKTLYPESSDIPATIHVVDSDMNKSSNSIDEINIFIWSDTDTKGTIITANETSVDSGTFEGTVYLTSQETHNNKLKVTSGDSIHAKYIDAAYPLSDNTNHDLTANAFIGGTGPPLERLVSSDWGVYDIKGNKVESIDIGQTVLIRANLTNSQNSVQPLAYIVIINDENDSEVYRSHLDATIEPNVTITPALSWTPEKTGHYMATIMMWEAIDNPSSLSPILESEFDVVDHGSNTTSDSDVMMILSSPLKQFKSGVSLDKIQCDDGLLLILKLSNANPACVKPETAQKLVERGWAKP